MHVNVLMWRAVVSLEVVVHIKCYFCVNFLQPIPPLPPSPLLFHTHSSQHARGSCLKFLETVLFKTKNAIKHVT